MNDIIPPNTSEKQCTGACQRWLPATTKFFYSHKTRSHKDGLSSQCRECQGKSNKNGVTRRKQHPQPKRVTYPNLPIVTLTCYTCGQSFQRQQRPPSYESKNTTGRFYCPEHSACNRNINPEAMAEAYLQGQSMEAIAEQQKCSSTTVRWYLKKLDIPIRDNTLGMVENIRKNGSNNKGKHTSKETRKKLSDAGKRYANTPEALKRRREQMLRMLVEGKFPFVSKLEDRVALELSRRGIVFTRQYGINVPGVKGYVACVDFMLADGRALEVNGSYWHADPREFPDGPVYEAQKVKVQKDKEKMQKLAELNIPVIVLWEIDLENDFIGTINKAL